MNLPKLSLLGWGVVAGSGHRDQRHRSDGPLRHAGDALMPCMNLRADADFLSDLRLAQRKAESRPFARLAVTAWAAWVIGTANGWAR